MSRLTAVEVVSIVLQGLVACVFLVAGALNLTGTMTEEIVRLGYPAYFSTIIGPAYLIAVLCLYQSLFPFLRNWAFGAMAATLVGGASSHILAGDPIGKAVPAIATLTMLVAGYALRGQANQS